MTLFSYAISGGIVSTVFFLQWWQRPEYPVVLWSTLGIACAIGLLLYRKQRRHSLLILCLAGSVLLVLLRVMQTHPPQELHTLLLKLDSHKNLTYYGKIVEDPDVRKNRINYTVELDGIRTASGETLSATGRILVTDLTQWPIYLRGSIVETRGSVLQAEEGYGDYLSVYGIGYTLRTFSMTQIGYDRPILLWRYLYTARQGFSRAIQRAFPEPSASLLDGLLTGSRSGLSDHLNDVFKRTGLTHIIAVSGSNITIVLSVIGGMLFFLPFRWRLFPSIIAVILFTLFVGAEASVVRACIMGILGLIALHTGNTKTMRLTILWTAAFMLVWNPRSLWYDAGFQLSFLAVIGLTEFQPLLHKPLSVLPLPKGIRDALLTTIAAQITAMPWVVYKFELLSLVSPLANVLVAPFIPIGMFVGFIGVLLQAISTPIGMVVSAIGHIVLSIIIRIATITDTIPYAAITLDTIGPFVVWMYYILIACAVAWLSLRQSRNTVRTNHNASA